ncbi:uncharacterized protein LOC142236312 [Haematobia irritans]|uniref:uncharacterized protein LOC142236312 n=1 Tax=Haematobia irritans TaxID=7368 RepID=UPI003F4F66E6
MNDVIISNPNSQHYLNQFETKLDQLSVTVSRLKDTIEKLEDTVAIQNSTIMEALATPKVFTEKFMGKEKQEANLRKSFPIQTPDDLPKTNNTINESNRSDYLFVCLRCLKGNSIKR